MQFSITSYGCRADDDSTITFPGHTAPEVLSAVRVGHVCCETTQTTALQAARLVHIRTVRCGVRARNRSTSHTGWSSNTVYSIYTYHERDAAQSRAVIASVSGLGPRLFLVDQLESGVTFRTLAITLDEPTLWDVCSAMVGTCDEAFKQGRRHMHREMCQAFADGRVTRRKGPQGITVKVKPAPLVWRTTPSGARETVIELTGPVPGANPVTVGSVSDAQRGGDPTVHAGA